MHSGKAEKQINHVTVPEKIYGAESNPRYESSPTRIRSAVLEKRVFQAPAKSAGTKGKKRGQTAGTRAG